MRAQHPVGRALWFIEAHLAREMALDDVAGAAGVSRFHLSRLFVVVTGLPVVRFVRGRRLSEAARTLAGGAPDILTVALDAGYGSHEAFTRAFRDHFGLTPEQVRAQGHLAELPLVEAIRMDTIPDTPLAAPRFETSGPLLLAGLGVRYNCSDTAGIAAQWQRFAAFLGHIPSQLGLVAYGVSHNMDEAGNLDYLCGAQVRDFTGLPPELQPLRLPAQRYAVFTHHDHIAAIRTTWCAILNDWLPTSGHTLADAASFERYDERFDPVTGTGGLEIWLPLAR